jgi:ABC-2 type transport system permease protein
MSGFRNFGLMYGRNIRQFPRIPVVLVFGLVMPVIQLLLFGNLFKGIAGTPDFAQAWPNVNYSAYIAPGVILFTIFVGMVNSSAAFIVDLRTGYFDKLRTTPVRPWQVLTARLLAEMTRVALQGTLILGISLLIALGAGGEAGIKSGLLGGVVMIVLATIFSACTAGLAVLPIALKTKSDQATQSMFPLFFILVFLTTSFASTDLMADWLQNVVKYNPVNTLVEVLRILMVGVNHGGQMDVSWPWEKIGIVLGASAIGAAFFGFLSYRAYRSSVMGR